MYLGLQYFSWKMKLSHGSNSLRSASKAPFWEEKFWNFSKMLNFFALMPRNLVENALLVCFFYSGRKIFPFPFESTAEFASHWNLIWANFRSLWRRCNRITIPYVDIFSTFDDVNSISVRSKNQHIRWDVSRTHRCNYRHNSSRVQSTFFNLLKSGRG